MIGMSQIKKKTLQGVAIGAAIGVAGIGLTLWWSISTIKSYQNGTNKKYNELYTQNVAVLTQDVTQGEVITSDMLTQVNIHKNTVPTGALTINSIAGQVAKYNIAANVPITDSMVTTEIISADIRSQEINTVLMPSDLVEGDYIDVRLMFPNGTDYIVLAQKNVKQITGQTMWLDLGEDERLLLNSAMVDSFLNTGSKLYATKYTDSDAQVKVVSDEVIADTTTNKTTGVDSTNVSTDDVTAIVQGKLRTSIESEIQSIKTATADEAVNTIFDLIIKYKSYASAITRTIENYQPNTQVREMMMSNGNILEEAKAKLSAEARSNIENGINNYRAETGDSYNNVVSGAQEAISNQKILRNELLTPEV